MNITVVRPFVNSLYEKKDLSVGEFVAYAVIMAQKTADRF